MTWKCRHMKIVTKELILELKVLTHDFKVLKHEDSSKSRIEVLTHDTKVSTYVNRGPSLGRLMIKSRHMILRCRHMEIVCIN